MGIKFLSLNSFHILFAASAITVLATFADSCKDGDISADPTDSLCTKFFMCDHGNQIPLSCPTGLMFNPTISACDWPSNVNCQTNSIEESSTSTANPSSTSSPKGTIASTTTVLPNTKSTTIASQSMVSTTSPTAAPSPTDNSISSSPKIKFAPYFDVMLKGPTMVDVYKQTGQKDFTLAFVLGSSESCVPKWGAANNLDDPEIMSPIRELQKLGGRFIVATGGAVGPYFEQQCTTVDTLAAAYKKVLDAVNTTHLDIDVESTIDTNTVTKALAKVQRDRPDTTVSFTLMVQAEDYGLNPPLGSDVLKSARDNGVRVDIVNPMAMEFSGSSADWGDAVIGAAKSVLRNMKEIWPQKSDGELKKMLGVTPMIGRNFNGRVFELSHAQKLVNWANANHIVLLAFWSVGRDNGGCANGAISATCSSVAQSPYQFTKIFQGFKG